MLLPTGSTILLLPPYQPDGSALNLLVLKLVPAIRRLQDVLSHCNAEAITVVLWRRDRRFVLSAIFDPCFELLVPRVCADAVCGED